MVVCGSTSIDCSGFEACFNVAAQELTGRLMKKVKSFNHVHMRVISGHLEYKHW